MRKQEQLEEAKRREEDEKKRREHLDKIMEENQKKIEEQQKKMAEDRLKMIEDQMKIDQEKQKLKKKEEKRVKSEQKMILGKDNSRPQLSFLDYLGFSTIALEIHSFDTDWNEVLIRYLRGSFNLLTQHLWPNKPCVNQTRVFNFACIW